MSLRLPKLFEKQEFSHFEGTKFESSISPHRSRPKDRGKELEKELASQKGRVEQMKKSVNERIKAKEQFKEDVDKIINNDDYTSKIVTSLDTSGPTATLKETPMK